MANTTFSQLQYRIADELGGRTDLLSPVAPLTESAIQLAIQDAVSFWENDRFYFNEYRVASAFSTVAGQEFYTSSDYAGIATIQHIDKLSLLQGTNRYFMEPRTMQYIEDVSMSTVSRGMPVDYAYYNFQLRFYPIPDAAYPINILGTKFFTALSGASDSNVWTTTAETLIRATAKKYLYRDTLRDDVSAASMQRSEDAEFSSLKGATFKKIASMKIRGNYF